MSESRANPTRRKRTASTEASSSHKMVATPTAGGMAAFDAALSGMTANSNHHRR